MNKKIIYGDTVGTPMARPNWTEENERSASYIRNKPKILEKLGEADKCLTYDGKKIIDETVLTVVECREDVDKLDPHIYLAYVRTDRKEFVPINLKVGVQYGGMKNTESGYRGELYVDPLLIDLFPCEPFVVTTELVDGYYHEFATDGATWFSFKSFSYNKCYAYYLYNNTDGEITVDGVTFPCGEYSNWFKCDADESSIYEYDACTDGLVHLMFKCSHVKFSSDAHFEDLEKILTTTNIYSNGKRGLYFKDVFGWERVDSNDFQIQLNAVSEKAHTHTISDDDSGNVTIKLASNSGNGDLDFDGDLDIGGGGDLDLGGDIVLQSIGIEDTKEMKTLTLDNSTYEIVDSEARERLNVVYDYLNPSWDTTLVFDGGDADVQVAVLDETILL